MINHNDYYAGWTTTIINPKTGKSCYGGAARNLRTAQVGGAAAIYNAGAIQAMQQIQPVVDRYEAQLKEYSKLLIRLTPSKLNHISR